MSDPNGVAHLRVLHVHRNLVLVVGHGEQPGHPGERVESGQVRGPGIMVPGHDGQRLRGHTGQELRDPVPLGSGGTASLELRVLVLDMIVDQVTGQHAVQARCAEQDLDVRLERAGLRTAVPVDVAEEGDPAREAGVGGCPEDVPT